MLAAIVLCASMLLAAAATPAHAAPGDALIFQLDGAIWRTTEAGTAPVRLTPLSVVQPCCAEPSHDGTRIAFQSGFGPYSINVMNADGSGLRLVTSGNGPVWSPDGTRLYIREFVGTWANFEVDVATGAKTPIARSVVRWSRDGSRYLYTFAGNLYASTAPVTTAPGGDLLVAVGVDSGWWSPDDSSILLRTDTTIDVVGSNGSGRRTIVDFGFGGSTPFADWSPDGRKITYVNPNLDGIYVADADGTGAVKILDGPGYNVPRFLGPARPALDADVVADLVVDAFDNVVATGQLAGTSGALTSTRAQLVAAADALPNDLAAACTHYRNAQRRLKGNGPSGLGGPAAADLLDVIDGQIALLGCR
ncbi:MAG: TolB family protein [Acidimicrobiia bacterium]